MMVIAAAYPVLSRVSLFTYVISFDPHRTLGDGYSYLHATAEETVA